MNTEHGGGHLEGAVNHKVRSSSKGREVLEEHLITTSHLQVGGRGWLSVE